MCVQMVTVVTVATLLAALAAPSAAISLEEKRGTVVAALADHPGLAQLDLQFCGSGSESQISRGPLGCGFPVVGDHPWLVALGLGGLDDANVTYWCSGVLVSDQFVITSARCAIGSADFNLKTVRAGEYAFASARDCLWYDESLCLEPQERATGSVVVHPKFDWIGGEASRYDIALVQLRTPVTIRHGVMPICLPIFSLRPPPKKQFSLSLGLQPSRWSAADGAAACCECGRDRNATTHVMDSEKLTDYNTTYETDQPCQYRLLSEREHGPDRCVGGGAACVADMGAPLVSADRFGSAFFVMGVASVMPSQNECRHRPGASVVYLPIQPHLEWLLDTIQCMADNTCRQL